MSAPHDHQIADQKRYFYLTRNLYRKIPDHEVRKRFWTGQPTFVFQVDALVRDGKPIDNKTILTAMENTYEIMHGDKEFAQESGFCFGMARNSINRVRRTLQ